MKSCSISWLRISRNSKNVGLVWLAQKSVTHFPEQPVYVIAFNPRGVVLSPESIQNSVAESLEVPGEFFVVCKSGNYKALAKKVIKAGKRII